MHLGGFIIRICHDARSPERQIHILGLLQYTRIFQTCFIFFAILHTWLALKFVCAMQKGVRFESWLDTDYRDVFNCFLTSPR